MPDDDERIRLTVSCRDCDAIPKAPRAGEVMTLAGGHRAQTMHNGVLVAADGYYHGELITRIVEGLRGHHEPQEERVFHEVLAHIPDGSAMIELGAYWSYYSLWFCHAVANGRAFMIEPELRNLEAGKHNFRLNDTKGLFLQARIGRVTDRTAHPPIITVDDFAREHGLTEVAILHSDIQGAEYDMLRGARELLGAGRARFVFISTHGHALHAACLHMLRSHGYRIIAEHTPGESYSVDGLIAATRDAGFPGRVRISRRRESGAPGLIKPLGTRLLSRLPALVFRALFEWRDSR